MNRTEDPARLRDFVGYSAVLYLICCIYGRPASRSFTSPSHPLRRRREVILTTERVGVLFFVRSNFD